LNIKIEKLDFQVEHLKVIVDHNIESITNSSGLFNLCYDLIDKVKLIPNIEIKESENVQTINTIIEPLIKPEMEQDNNKYKENIELNESDNIQTTDTIIEPVIAEDFYGDVVITVKGIKYFHNIDSNLVYPYTNENKELNEEIGIWNGTEIEYYDVITVENIKYLHNIKTQEVYTENAIGVLWDGTEILDESRIITVKGCKYIHDIPTYSIGWFCPDDGEIVYSLKITVNGVKYVVNTQDNIVYTNYDLEEEVIGIWNGTDIEFYDVIEEELARLNDELAKIKEESKERAIKIANKKEELARTIARMADENM